MRIYLDTCCYNRPYDNQNDQRIYAESQAIKFIQNEIKRNAIELVTSYLLFFENSKNPFSLKRTYIAEFMQKYSSVYVPSDLEKEIVTLAKPIIETGVKQYDAYHVACAILAECEHFLTTDKRLLKYHADTVFLLNPLDYIQIYGGDIR